VLLLPLKGLSRGAQARGGTHYSEGLYSMRSALVQGLFCKISHVVILEGSFLCNIMRIASFFLVLSTFSSFNILHFNFYIGIQFLSTKQRFWPVRTRKVLLVARPATPACTARPTLICMFIWELEGIPSWRGNYRVQTLNCTVL